MTAIPVRVMVEDAWDQVTLELPPRPRSREAKQRALALTHARGSRRTIWSSSVERRCWTSRRASLRPGVVANAALIVLPRRRRPVR